jgi:hypothetical protein
MVRLADNTNIVSSLVQSVLRADGMLVSADHIREQKTVHLYITRSGTI